MTEEKLQHDCYIYFHNTYPELRGLLCYNLNNSKSARDGAKNRGLGLQKGRSDLTLYHRNGTHHIEMKTLTGRQSPHQKKWQAKVQEHGYQYHIIRTLEDFKTLIRLIIL